MAFTSSSTLEQQRWEQIQCNLIISSSFNGFYIDWSSILFKIGDVLLIEIMHLLNHPAVVSWALWALKVCYWQWKKYLTIRKISLGLSFIVYSLRSPTCRPAAICLWNQHCDTSRSMNVDEGKYFCCLESKNDHSNRFILVGCRCHCRLQSVGR